jgi:hypothetical protein
VKAVCRSQTMVCSLLMNVEKLKNHIPWDSKDGEDSIRARGAVKMWLGGYSQILGAISAHVIVKSGLALFEMYRCIGLAQTRV